MDRIRDAVREAGIFVVLGYSERYNGSMYIAQVGRTSKAEWYVSVAQMLIIASPSSIRPDLLFIIAARSSPRMSSGRTGATGKVKA